MAEVGRMRMPWDLWAGDNELGGETMGGGHRMVKQSGGEEGRDGLLSLL